jgi:MoaA/NifB/PqqE/SkfB family radical SAM enzyme
MHPTHPDYELDVETLKKLPGGFDHINITGGEPTLRTDLLEICDVLHPRARTLEISTNGLRGSALEHIVRKYPDVKIRISVEGFAETNDAIRGERNGFTKKIDAMKSLIAAGGTDLGFATTFQDENINEVVDLYHMAEGLKVEFATSALHNAFQFHKNDNSIYDRLSVAKRVEGLITEMLRSWSIKNWFRGYMNLGLIAKILGQNRLHPCTQGTDNVFIDPWGDVYACNVRNDLHMGNLHEQEWDEIYHGARAAEIRAEVASCPQNCWMVSSAKTAIRNKHIARLPKLAVLGWVIANKTRTVCGRPIPFARYIDYSDVRVEKRVVRRRSYLTTPAKKQLQPAQSRRYVQIGEFFNR